jgi:16S rRNA processing protein RimM
VKSDFVAIGRLGAPKGVRGDLKVHSYSGESQHFRDLKEVELRPTAGEADSGTGASRTLRLKVERVEGSGASLTMAFPGYPSPESARALTGLDIVVPRSSASPLRPNQWYVDDLVGLVLVDASDSAAKGRRLAEVRSVLEGGAEPWLEVVAIGPDVTTQATQEKRDPARIADRNSERVSVVPFRKEFVGDVDLEAGTIELLVPELLSPDLP